MRILRLSRSVIYEQIRTGRLRTVKQGRTRLAPAAAIRDYIALLDQLVTSGRVVHHITPAAGGRGRPTETYTANPMTTNRST